MFRPTVQMEDCDKRHLAQSATGAPNVPQSSDRMPTDMRWPRPTIRWRMHPTLSELALRLRTEADTPLRQGFSVAVGAVIACFPLYGLHLPLAVVASRLLRLNTVKTYLVTQLNNPVVAPFVVYADLQVGSLIRRGHPYHHTIDTLRELEVAFFATDIFLGAAAVGLVAGAVMGIIAYTIVKQEHNRKPWKRLLETTSRMYLKAGMLHWELTRAQLRLRRRFYCLVADETTARTGLVVDLQCGRGVLLALISVARGLHSDDPRHSVADAGLCANGAGLLGVDRRRRSTRVASEVLGAAAEIQCTDPTSYEIRDCDVVIMPTFRRGRHRTAEDDLLRRAAVALDPGGIIIARVRRSVLPGGHAALFTDVAGQLEACGLLVQEPSAKNRPLQPVTVLAQAPTVGDQ